ncbi:MAG: ketol-acid reductoisomerase [Candidatus Eisenbacteria bacterium]
MTIITDGDIKGEPLSGKTVSVFGYGNQGEAQALNLRDSGVDVLVALKEASRSRKAARAAGFEVLDPGDAASGADICALLVPDRIMAEFISETLAPVLRAGATIVFAHGYPLRFGGAAAPEDVDVVVVAPMGPGLRLRERYVNGEGLPASFAVEQDATGRARATALEYAKAIGCARVGLFETTAAEETEIDLFAEQAVLCGGVTRLIEAGFDTLVEAGYSPDLAYLECLYELDLTVNLIRRFGIDGMRKRISRTALYGDLTRGGRVIGPDVRDRMRQVLSEVRDGTFAAEMVSDEMNRGAELERALAEQRATLLEEVGRRLAGVAHEPPEPESP